MKKFFTILSIAAVAFMNAQVASIDENFESFPTPTTSPRVYGNLPYGGWKSDNVYPKNYISKENNNTKIVSYSMMSANVPIHIITPELISTKGNLKFDGSIAGMGSGVLQIGVSDTGEFDSFTMVQELTLGKAMATNEVNISNEAKYIVFKFIPHSAHTAFTLDNVVFQPESMATTDFQLKSEPVFAVDNVSKRLVFANNNVKNVKIYNSLGALVIDTKVNGYVNISTLNSGVYFVVSESKSGEIKKSKFIKK